MPHQATTSVACAHFCDNNRLNFVLTNYLSGKILITPQQMAGGTYKLQMGSDTRHSPCICGHWGDVIEEELHRCTTYFKNLKKQ